MMSNSPMWRAPKREFCVSISVGGGNDDVGMFEQLVASLSLSLPLRDQRLNLSNMANAASQSSSSSSGIVLQHVDLKFVLSDGRTKQRASLPLPRDPFLHTFVISCEDTTVYRQSVKPKFEG